MPKKKKKSIKSRIKAKNNTNRKDDSLIEERVGAITQTFSNNGQVLNDSDKEDAQALVESIGKKVQKKALNNFLVEVLKNYNNVSLNEINQFVSAAKPKKANEKDFFAQNLQALVGSLGNDGSILETKNLINAFRDKVKQVSLPQINSFIQNVKRNNNQSVKIADNVGKLINAVGGRNTISEIQRLVSDVREVMGDVALEKITLLLNKVLEGEQNRGNKFNVSGALAGLVQGLSGKLGVADTIQLIGQINESWPQESLDQLNGLIKAAFKFEANTLNNTVGALKALETSINGKSQRKDTTALINEVYNNWKGASITDINSLVQETFKSDANKEIDIAKELKTIVSRISGRATIEQTKSLITAINGNWGGVSLADNKLIKSALKSKENPVDQVVANVRALVNSVNGTSSENDLADLVDAVYKKWSSATITDITSLVTEARRVGLNNGVNMAKKLTTLVNGLNDKLTIQQTTTLIQTINNRPVPSSIDHMTILLQAAVKAKDGDNDVAGRLTTLIGNIGDRSTFKEAADMVKKAADNYSETFKLETLNNMVVRVNNARALNPDNPGTTLNTIFDSIGKFGAFDQVYTLVDTAYAKLGTVLNDVFLNLLKRNKKNSTSETPKKVVALLNGLYLDGLADNVENNKDRFIKVASKIPLFLNRAAVNVEKKLIPILGNANYYDENNAVELYASQDSFNHFYKRHSYNHFDFADIKIENGMYEHPTTNLKKLLGQNMQAAINANIVLNNGGRGERIVEVNDFEIGINGSNRVTRFYPVRGDYLDVNFRASEMRAINNLA